VKTRRSESGGGAVKLIISLAILAIIAQAIYIALPIYVAVYDFTSMVDKEAQFGAQKEDSQIKQGLLEHAAELNLPVAKDQVTIHRTQRELKITSSFTVPVETLFYTYNWQVHAEKAYPLF
jgi:hypothetical protein